MIFETRRSAVISLCLCLLCPNVSIAQDVTYAPVAPQTQILYGYQVKHTCNNISGSPKSFLWEYQPAGCNQWFPGTSANTGSTVSPYEIYPGTFTVRCTVFYYPAMRGSLTRAQPTATITVPPPDSLTIISGDRTNYQIGSQIPIVFQMYCKGVGVGPQGTGMAQEQITKVTNSAGTVIAGGLSWIPSPGSQSPNIYITQGTIVAKRRRSSGRIFNGAAAGSTLSTAT